MAGITRSADGAGPGLLDGFLASTYLDLTPFNTPPSRIVSGRNSG